MERKMVQSGEPVWELGAAASLRVTDSLGVDKINVYVLDALIEGHCFFSHWEERGRGEGKGSASKAAAFAPLCGSLAWRLLPVQ